ncbi:MAG: hypothetical protein CVU84_02270 [Firmicutes bacterium HGW-Firmicutes-1]|jgi:stage V sporulation protein B|nr:MAG: hypothetical protein CVU84_02270 [Firmicutes bacterium HGW-Firmicutes-1]
MKKQTIIKGTLILTIGGLISRVLGFVNRIYLSNIIGAEGMGLYQLIFPIYMICYTFCCSGIFTAISRLTAEEMAKGSKSDVKKMIRIVTAIATSLGVALMVLLYLNAEFISIRIIHEPRIVAGLRIVSISIPFTAIAHCVKGYFYGVNKPTLPAISQVTEQIIRISIIYLLSSSFILKGLEYACAVAVIGMAVGEISTCLFVYLFYYGETRKILISKAAKTYRYFVKKISAIAIPLTTNRLITTILSSFETILIPGMLKSYGYSHNYAISVYGTLTGMAFPLIFFPTVVTTSASLMLLPAISEAYARKQKGVIKNTVSITIKFSIMMGIVFNFFFLAFGKDLGLMVFNEGYVGTLLISLSFLCPFLYLQTTLGSLLNGIDKHMITFRNNIIGLGLRIMFIYLLIPQLGLKGYLIGLLVSLIVVSVLDIYCLVKATSLSFNPLTFIVMPALCCVGTLALHTVFMRIYTFSYGFKVNTLIDMAFYFIVVMPLLLMTRCISFKDFKI